MRSMIKPWIVGTLVHLHTSSPTETHSIGHQVGSLLPPSSIIGLDGPLGVGKTCFAQGVAMGLGVPPSVHVTSPAYTLVQEYPLDQMTFVHIDFYRLDTLSLGDYVLFEELFAKPNQIILVEWASKFMDEFTSESLLISIEHCLDEDHRSLSFFSNSSKYSPLLHQLAGHVHSVT